MPGNMRAEFMLFVNCERAFLAYLTFSRAEYAICTSLLNHKSKLLRLRQGANPPNIVFKVQNAE